MKFLLTFYSIGITTLVISGFEYKECKKGRRSLPKLNPDFLNVKVECDDDGCDKGRKMITDFGIQAEEDKLPEYMTVSANCDKCPEVDFPPTCYPFKDCENFLLCFQGVLSTPIVSGNVTVDVTVKEGKPEEKKQKCVRFSVSVKAGETEGDKPPV